MTNRGQGFSPRRELVLMARVITRWLRANGFPGERVSFEIKPIKGAPWRSTYRKFWRAYFMRGRHILCYGGALSESDEEAIDYFYRGAIERFSALTAAELEVRFAILGQDAVKQLLNLDKALRQGLSLFSI